MYKFPTDYVTILRQRGSEYREERITTLPILPGCAISPEQNRENVISRLRKDPSVLLVLEPTNGRCDERFSHPSGFEFHIVIEEVEEPAAQLTVTYNGTRVFDGILEAGEDEDSTTGTDWLLFDKLLEVLYSIEHGDYSFADESCPGFVTRKTGDPVDLFHAYRILSEAGFQTERINTVGYLSAPVLVAHENDVALLGSRHFDGESLFVEMKRFFHGTDDDAAIEKAVKEVRVDGHTIRVIHWEDGSWSFRSELDVDTDTENLIVSFNSEVSALREFITQVEANDNIGPEPWDITTEQRHYFIYETIDQSLKLSKLSI